jgi:hypothetical protein
VNDSHFEQIRPQHQILRYGRSLPWHFAKLICLVALNVRGRTNNTTLLFYACPPPTRKYPMKEMSVIYEEPEFVEKQGSNLCLTLAGNQKGTKESSKDLLPHFSRRTCGSFGVALFYHFNGAERLERKIPDHEQKRPGYQLRFQGH